MQVRETGWFNHRLSLPQQNGNRVVRAGDFPYGRVLWRVPRFGFNGQLWATKRKQTICRADSF